MLNRLPSFFWKSPELKLCNLSRIAWFSSASEKNCSFRSAAVIHVDIFLTELSALGLSFLSSIKDKKHYLQNQIIFNLGGIA